MSEIRLRASIDLGTNTCLLLIAEWNSERKEVVRVIGDYTAIVRLGQGVDRTKRFSDEAMERTYTCLQSYVEKIRAAKVDPRDVICVATSQARDAANSKEFFEKAEKGLGLQFRIISGEEEARFTFLGGLLPGMQPERTAVIDIGGGSTELISDRGGVSFDVGSVRFTERYLKSDPVTDVEFWECQAVLDEVIQTRLAWRKSLAPAAELLGVAGTVTTLAAWHLGLKKFDATLLDQVRLSRGDVHRCVEELKWRTVSERQKLTGVEPGRADILLAGALILWRTMELLDFSECRVSTRGLRFGVLAG